MTIWLAEVEVAVPAFDLAELLSTKGLERDHKYAPRSTLGRTKCARHRDAPWSLPARPIEWQYCERFRLSFAKM